MGHFYSKEGRPHFDLAPREAKARGLLYSVTEILRVLHSQGLEMWKINSAIEYCFKNPVTELDEETDLQTYKKMVRGGMYDDSATALGTKIHDEIEHILRDGRALEDTPKDLIKYVQPCIEYFMSKKFKIIDIEQIVVNEDEGYAGTADVVAQTKNGQDFIMDWKSTTTIPTKPYYTQKLQIGAYAVATFGEQAVKDHQVWGANAYVSTRDVWKRGDQKGQAKFKVHSYRPEEIAELYEQFKTVCALWRIIEDYDPRNHGDN